MILLNACMDSTTNTESSIDSNFDTDFNLEQAITLNELGEMVNEKITLSKDDLLQNISELPSADRAKISEADSNLMNGWIGPFQAQASEIILYENELVYINDLPGLATGYYICDYLLYRAVESIPPGSFAKVDDPVPVGWTDSVNRIPGVSVSTTSGGIVYMNTITLHVKSTYIGQSVDSYFPNQLTDGFNYTYYYYDF